MNSVRAGETLHLSDEYGEVMDASVIPRWRLLSTNIDHIQLPISRLSRRKAACDMAAHHDSVYRMNRTGETAVSAGVKQFGMNYW